MAYRDELDAAKIRRDNLKRELDEVDRVAKRRAEVARELEDASRAVDRARAKVALPLLARVRIASACSAKWDEMNGDERVRHCGACDKKVYDLSAMRAEEAESLLQAHGTSVCARFYRRADGTIMTSDCAPGARKALVRNVVLGSAAAAIVGSSALSVVAGAAMFVIAERDRSAVEMPPDVYELGEPAFEQPPGGLAFEPLPGEEE